MSIWMTQEYLKSIVDYDPETGFIVWAFHRGSRSEKGRTAGYKRPNNGYITISINKKTYLAHRLAWLYMYGEWPNGQVDHINHIRTDNRIKNLRVVDSTGNNKNSSLPSTNTSGHVGVYFDKKIGKWMAKIHKNNKQIWLGYFLSIDDAIIARKTAEKILGFHQNHGKRK